MCPSPRQPGTHPRSPHPVPGLRPSDSARLQLLSELGLQAGEGAGRPGLSPQLTPPSDQPLGLQLCPRLPSRGPAGVPEALFSCTVAALAWGSVDPQALPAPPWSASRRRVTAGVLAVGVPAVGWRSLPGLAFAVSPGGLLLSPGLRCSLSLRLALVPLSLESYIWMERWVPPPRAERLPGLGPGPGGCGLQPFCPPARRPGFLC